MTYSIVSLDWFIPVLTLYREGRNQDEYALRAIGHVIANRVKDDRWPNTPHDVCLNYFVHRSRVPPFDKYRVYEFSCHSPKDPNSVVWPTSDEDAAWGKCAKAWYDANHEGDFTGGANSYHSYVDKGKYPDWATEEAYRITAGAFKLYKR